MPSSSFKLATPAIKLPQTYVIDHMAMELAYNTLHEILQKHPTSVKLNTCQLLYLYQSSHSSAENTDN
jgi:hypothetical protein